MRLLLDTNAYSAMKRGHAGVIDVIRRSDEVLLSVIVLGELLYGFRHGSRAAQNTRELDSFLRTPYVTKIEVGSTTADRYASIASSLRAKGSPIPTNDLWIAAHALETGADLVTFDSHFHHVEGIFVVQPTDGPENVP
ncbi:MAG: type II toxin-antitoxin system VapC family toxin [Myxococcota bacterium]